MQAATETKQGDALSVPKGYKKTKIGWIPEEWEEYRLGEICPIFKSGEGITTKDISEKGEYAVFGGNGLRGYAKSFTHEGDFFLIGRQGALCGNIVRISGKNYVSEHAIAVQTDENNDNYYLAYNLEYLNLNRLSESSAQPGLAVNKLIKYKVYLPPLPEQQKIAQILSTWDKAIEQNQKLIEQLKRRKKGLMQQLLTGKTRLKGFGGEWKEVQLGRHLVFHKQKSSSSDTYDVFSSSKKGLIMQSDYYGGDNRITSRDIEGFNIIPPEYATYRSRSDDGIFTFNSNNHGITGVVSKYYPVFKCIDSNQNFIIQTLNYNHYKVRRYAVGTSQLVLSEKDLKQLKFHLPSHEEQNAIDNLLTTADKEIKIQETNLQQLQYQKKGLMQQLLTGAKRVLSD